MNLKKLALAAAVAALAVPAMAQSQVTVYGRVDLSLAQQGDAADNKEMRNGSGSRLGFRGVEDLGGDLKAFFQIEHRFNANDGDISSAAFWHGKSLVGLQGGFGRVWLGRDETPAYVLGQTVADPWGTDTVAGNADIVRGGIGKQRYSSSVNYAYSMSGISFGAQFAEADKNASGDSADRPYSFGLGYKAGALQLGFGYENPSDKDDNWLTLYAGYNFGVAKVGAFFGTGNDTNDNKRQAYLLSATAPLAGGEFRASYGQLKNKDAAANGILRKQFGVGYHYPLSKRTTVYVDLVNKKRDNQNPANEKTGYDLGIKHNF